VSWTCFDLNNETVPRLKSVINPLLEVFVMNIRPLYDRIVVKRIEGDVEKTSGGLFIPESAKEKPQEGEVFAVGKGKRLEDGKVVALDVQKGDRILFGKYSGSEIKLDGTEYLIMREDEILGILEK
jgi:chaperonin GroES